MSPTACDESHRLRAPRPSCESMELSSESHEATRAAEASVSTVDITQEVEDPTIMHRAESAESATALARVAPRLPVPQPSSAAPSAASSTQVEVEPKRNDGISVADHHSRANETGHGEVVPVQQAAAQEERVTEEEPAPMDSVPLRSLRVSCGLKYRRTFRIAPNLRLAQSQRCLGLHRGQGRRLQGPNHRPGPSRRRWHPRWQSACPTMPQSTGRHQRGAHKLRWQNVRQARND